MISHTRRNTLLAAAILAGGAIALAGPLTPSAGPVGSTFKTLSEVEPRTAITSLPFTISQSGSYYLAKNLTGAAGLDGITVNADDVTIDLGGFTLTGPGGAGAFAAVKAIQHNNVTVRNGTLKNWPGGGLAFHFTKGGRAEDLSFRDCQSASIFTSDGSTIRRCSVQGGDSMVAGASSIIESCTVSGAAGGLSAGNGGVIRDCVVSGVTNGNSSIAVGESSTVSNCTVTAGGSQGINAMAGSTVTGNSVRGCNAAGIVLASGCTATGNTTTSNGIGTGAGGMLVMGSGSHIDGNLFYGNAIGLHVTGTDDLITRNAARANTNGNYTIAANNEYGAIITSPGANFAATNPFANFAY